LPQHFLLTSAARTLSLASVMRMSDEEAEQTFIKLRWAGNDGKAFCPHCGCLIVYSCRRPNGALRWRCKACRKDFSVTSGTLFAFHKLPLKAYLLAIAIFCNEVKGKSMLAMSRDLGVQYKTSFVLAHKMREAMATEVRTQPIGGDGRKAEIDGGYFGGYVKPANRRENRRDRRLRRYQSGKRKVVVVIRKRDGRTLPGVFHSEVEASPKSSKRSPPESRPGPPLEQRTKLVLADSQKAALRVALPWPRRSAPSRRFGA
jgi:transposase-like protein